MFEVNDPDLFLSGSTVYVEGAGYFFAEQYKEEESKFTFKLLERGKGDSGVVRNGLEVIIAGPDGKGENSSGEYDKKEYMKRREEENSSLLKKTQQHFFLFHSSLLQRNAVGVPLERIVSFSFEVVFGLQ